MFQTWPLEQSCELVVNPNLSAIKLNVLSKTKYVLTSENKSQESTFGQQVS